MAEFFVRAKDAVRRDLSAEGTLGSENDDVVRHLLNGLWCWKRQGEAKGAFSDESEAEPGHRPVRQGVSSTTPGCLVCGQKTPPPDARNAGSSGLRWVDEQGESRSQRWGTNPTWFGVERTIRGGNAAGGCSASVWSASLRRLHVGVVWRRGEQNMDRKGVSLKIENFTLTRVLMTTSRLQRPVRSIFSS